MGPRHLVPFVGAFLTLAAVAGAAAARTLVPVTSPETARTPTASTVMTSRAAPPPEWAAGCPVPTLEQCQQPGYLQGELDDAQGCGALQGANDWTCSALLQQAAAAHPAAPSIFAHELVPSGIVGSAVRVPQDPDDAVATSYAGELTSPASQHYGASLAASGPATFAIEDPRGAWQEQADQAFGSCQEYAHDSYYEVANFWYEVGRNRHDFLRTFEIAFGAWLSHGSIGTRHLDGSDFTDVRGHGVLPSSRFVWRNRFFDLPGAHAIQGPALQAAGPAGPPSLRAALAAYDPLGAEIVALVVANGEQGTKDMAFYQTYFENMAVEAVSGLGLSLQLGANGGGSGGPVDAYAVIGGDGPTNGPAFQNAVPGDPSIAITGQVPLSFSGGKLMRRMFAAELDELYDLQREKDRLVDEWLALDRHFAGSGWTIQDLLDELDPELGLSVTPPPPGVCCGTLEPSYAAAGGGSGGGPAYASVTFQQGHVPVESSLGEESAARKAVLDALLDVYARANDFGCLDAGVTYCDFSPKEFALEAIPDAHEEQQAAYEECLGILPPPFAANLGQTRKIVDPVADTQGISVPPSLQASYATLLDMQCFVTVDPSMTASHLHWIEDNTAACRALIPAYQLMLTAFLEDVALAEAKARVASIPELLDPDTGAIVAPGRSASWHERKGSRYFGLEMQYHYAFESEVDGNVCNFDLAAGGDFAASVDVLALHLPLVDVAAWVRTGPELVDPGEKFVDVHAEVLGVALFPGQSVGAVDEGALVEIHFARSDSRREADVAGLTTNFFLGPIPMSLSVGAGGALGYRFDMAGHFTAFETAGASSDLCPELAIGATLEPYVGVYGFIEVALDIVIARAGVRGQLTILEVSIPVSVDMTLEAVAAQPVDLRLGVGMSVATRFETLAGRISAFGELGPCPLCVRLEKSIVKWDGFRFEETLYDQRYDVSVADLALVLGD